MSCTCWDDDDGYLDLTPRRELTPAERAAWSAKMLREWLNDPPKFIHTL